MGKHRTAKQDEIFIAFMKKHPDLAKGELKLDKELVAKSWEQLARELNRVGPPMKTADEWRRVWKDWKLNVKRQITHKSKVCGVTVKKKPLTATANAIALITNLYQIVDQVKPLDLNEDASFSRDLDNTKYEFLNIDSDDSDYIEETPSKKHKLELSDCIPNTPFGSNDTKNNITTLTASESSLLKDIASELRNFNQHSKAQTEAVLEMGSQITDLMQQQLDERKKFNIMFENFMSKME